MTHLRGAAITFTYLRAAQPCPKPETETETLEARSPHRGVVEPQVDLA
jgi:hypothetical protein